MESVGATISTGTSRPFFVRAKSSRPGPTRPKSCSTRGLAATTCRSRATTGAYAFANVLLTVAGTLILLL